MGDSEKALSSVNRILEQRKQNSPNDFIDNTKQQEQLVSSQLVQSMMNFMKNTEDKLQKLEQSVYQLSLDIQKASIKSDLNSDQFNAKLDNLQREFSNTKLSTLQQESVSIIPQTTFVPLHGSINESFKQEDDDAILAKKLQEEFDNENRNVPKQYKRPIIDFTKSTPSIPNFNQQANIPKKEPCPVCSKPFLIGKELEEHVDIHFSDNNNNNRPSNNVPSSSSSSIVNQPLNFSRNTSSQFVSPPSYYSPPPMYRTQHVYN